MKTTLLSLAIASIAATVLSAQGSYVPNRVYDTARGAFADFEVMLARAAQSDVVFLGEQHDDPNTHRLELAVLEGIARRREGKGIVLSLEMFERDVQETLDHYLMGHMSEEEFLKTSRPWPRYATDYRPLVEFAKAHNWPVVAANVPRPIASEVSRAGWSALEGKSEADRKWFAGQRTCPTGDDDYYRKFMAAMGAHPGSTGENFYLAQCLKDETMSESIHTAFNASGIANPVIVHVNGAFHSDYGLGTASRVARRMPRVRTVVISMLPGESLDDLTPSADEAKRGNYLVYTVRTAK
jgi:uncharacterized iron-regulated protein